MTAISEKESTALWMEKKKSYENLYLNSAVDTEALK